MVALRGRFGGKLLALVMGAGALAVGIEKYPSIDWIWVIGGIILVFIGLKIPLSEE